MKVFKLLLVLALVLYGSVFVQAQRAGKQTRFRSQYSSPKVRGSKARLVCPTFDRGKYPMHALGIKMGDPFAITYKYYPGKRISFALDLGKSASGLYNAYFREKFDFYVMADTFPSNESSMVYLNHRVISDPVVELKVLFHIDGKMMPEGLRAYAGAGWEWKRTQLVYDYEYVRSYGQEPASPFDSFQRTRVAMGPQVALGIEYSYFKVPVSAFMEVECFTDIQADPGWQRIEGGVGLRYVFQ